MEHFLHLQRANGKVCEDLSVNRRAARGPELLNGLVLMEVNGSTEDKPAGNGGFGHCLHWLWWYSEGKWPDYSGAGGVNGLLKEGQIG